MKSVMIIGGYGGFGARLSARLAKAGWRVLVAGRRLEAATTFCAGLEHAIPIVADREGDLGPILAQHQPDLVIDAAGPFQGNDHRVPLACIAARLHYLDLADARDFVCTISTLDEAAKAAGVSIISGASSVPALSGAVVRALIGGMSKVAAINIAISASNRATAGPAVAASIMSYVGKPLSLWRGGRWADATGWHMLRRERFDVVGRKSLQRLTALSDVPDHTIMPEMVAHLGQGRPATTFRAGPEFSFQVLGIWMLSWLVKWRLIPSLSALSGWLRYLQAPTNGLGSDRSGMVVEVKGFVGDAGTIRRWTLIAEDGDGPEIPTLAACLLSDMIVEGQMKPGAYDASTLLTLEQFQPQFDGLSIYHERMDTPYKPLYQRVLGHRFATLPPAVADMHLLVGDGGATGEAIVTRGQSLLAKIVCAIMGFPPNGSMALRVSFDEHHGAETWTRDFGGTRFSSVLSQQGPNLIERFGPLAFAFGLDTNAAGLSMHIRGWTAFGVPMPRFFGPKIQAREWQEGDAFCFDVAIGLPLIGPIVRYQGRLHPA
jgi:NAD(P)-dependent dehydrogenase (short-subunit alcohol dehydrogenase family)